MISIIKKTECAMKFLSTILISLALISCAKSDAPEAYPSLIKRVQPVYPRYALENHINGEVKFNFDVDAGGKVSEMRIIKSEPQHLFDDAVILAVSQWRFEKNKPAKDMQRTFKFSVNLSQ